MNEPSDEMSCLCPRCCLELHIEECGDIECVGQCRNKEQTVVQPLDDGERAEMVELASFQQGLLPEVLRGRLEELRHRDIDAQDDRIAESIEFPPDEGM